MIFGLANFQHEDFSKVKVSGVNLPFTLQRYIEKCQEFISHQKSTQSQMTSSPVSHHQKQRNVAHMMMRSKLEEQRKLVAEQDATYGNP